MARAGARKTSMGMGGGNPRAAALARQICSITDPFCAAAKGSKYPDTGAGRTLAWQTESWYTVTTDASGKGAIFFNNDPAIGAAPVATYASGLTNIVATLGANQSYPGYLTFSSVGPNWRLISIGVEIKSILSSMNNQGSLGIAAIPYQANAVNTVGMNLDDHYYAANERISTNDPSGLAGFARMDGVVSKTFKGSGTPPTNWVGSYGSDVLVAYMVGGPAIPRPSKFIS